MIGVPMPNPRDSIIEDLNRQMDQFFGSGKAVMEIPPGVSGEKELTFGTNHGKKLRAERNKLAPTLKKLADNGMSLYQAAAEAGIDYKRARLIAQENGFSFPT